MSTLQPKLNNMAGISVSQSDHAVFSDPAPDKIIVKQYTYNTDQEAQDQVSYFNNPANEPEFNTPNGDQVRLTRGQVIFMMATLRTIIVAIRLASAVPLPFPS